MPATVRTFNEREFYLAEFRGRSIGFAWPAEEIPSVSALSDLLPALVGELVANGTRVVLMSPREDVLQLAGEGAEIDAALPNEAGIFEPKPWAPRLWRSLRAGGCAGLRLPTNGFEPACRRAAVALRLAKVVWIQSTPPVHRPNPSSSGAPPNRISVVDLAHLDRLLDQSRAPDAAPDELNLVARSERKGILEAIRSMIRGGVPSVNVCRADDVAKELLTYAGAGIFFTRDRYAEVRPLALDDYDQANDLIARGEEDGYLLPRDETSRDRVLAHAVGLFVEGRYLAGIGALLPYSLPSRGASQARSAIEIVSLYALTRYAGEGVGSQIVRFAIERAREEGFEYAFSCTTSERVADFFRRSGFEIVRPDEIPASKWDDYDADRRARVICLRFDCREHLE